MMKALLYRDIYIIRKNLLISIGIYTVMSLFGILGILSAKYGNIAKYSPDDIFPRDVMRASLYISIVAGVFLACAVEYLYGIIRKDYEIGWNQYQVASGIPAKCIVGSKYIEACAICLISLAFSVGGFTIMKRVSGIESTGILPGIIPDALSRHEGMIIIVAVTIVLLVIFDYFSLLEYIYKGKNSEKVDIIMVIPIPIAVVIFMVGGFLYSANDNFSKMLIKIMEYLGNNVVLLYAIPITVGALLTIICYTLSVRIVKREGRQV